MTESSHGQFCPVDMAAEILCTRYSDLSPAQRRFWLVVAPGEEVYLCSSGPGFGGDLFVSTDARAMTAIWMGITTLARASEEGSPAFTCGARLFQEMRIWLGLGVFARERGPAVA